jgi:Fe-S-cluster containining protein
MSRQQRRARLRQLTNSGQSFNARGLPRSPTAEQLLAVAVVFREVLNERSAWESTLDLADVSLRTYERSLKAAPSQIAIACKKGCNYCCHSFVAATVPEILFARQAADKARYFIEHPDTLGLARELRTLTPENRIGRRLPCALLVSDGCSIYPSRPMMCRVATSLDVESCIEEFEGRNLSADVPVARTFITHGGNVRTAFVAAAMSAGLDCRSYELSSSVAAADDLPALSLRWLAGERVFDGATSIPPDASLVARAEPLVQELRQLFP